MRNAMEGSKSRLDEKMFYRPELHDLDGPYCSQSNFQKRLDGPYCSQSNF